MCPAREPAGFCLARSQRPRSARFLHVSEDNEPDWLAELAKAGEAVRQ